MNIVFVSLFILIAQSISHISAEDIIQQDLQTNVPEISRLSRPDGQLPTSPHAIAGDSCDLTKVLELLAIIRSRIGNVFQEPGKRTVLSTLGDPVELGPGLNIVRKLLLLQKDFSGVFTTLDDIKTTVTECCQDLNETITTCCEEIITTVTECCQDLHVTITTCCFDIFNSLTNINVDFGPIFTSLLDIRETLTECCADIKTDFAGVFTALNNLTFTCFVSFEATVTVITDLSGIFTTLADIKESLTECCADSSNNFAGTFTTLTDIRTTLTTCCFDIEQDLAGVFTVLNNLRPTCTFICDFSGIFTAIYDVKSTVTTCCNEIFNDFTGVFTSLSDIRNSLTSCCGEINNNFIGTFTVLADIQTTLTTCCNILIEDFNGTFTSLADIRTTLTSCCDTMVVDFSGVFTSLTDIRNSLTTCCSNENNNFAGTFTVLADIKNTLTTCCNTMVIDFNGVFTSLTDIRTSLTNCCAAEANNFAGTFTVLADIKSSLTTCCNTLIQDFNGTFTMLTDIRTSLTSCCQDINANFCNPRLIRQSDFGPTGATSFTISVSGIYKLAENITYNGAANTQAIVITTSNVIYDQQCFILKQGNNNPNVDGVRANSNFSDITIMNGQIKDFTRAGISIQNNVDRLKILNLTCLNCGVRGIELLGASVGSATIAEALIDTVDILLSATFAASGNNALFLQGCLDTKVQNCRINENGNSTQSLAVIRLNNCLKCSFLNVDINDNIARTFLRGVELSSTSSFCRFENCNLRNNISIGDADGFILTSNSNCSNNEFINCEVLLLTGSSAVDAFMTDTGCNDNLFINCRALSNTSTGAAANAVVHGFNFINNTRNTCIECLANANTAPNSTAGPRPVSGAIGYDLNTTTSCNIIRSIALANSTGSGSLSTGFKISFGNRNIVKECQSHHHSIGFRIDPDNSTSHAVSKNMALKNTTQYSGFIAGSTQNAATITNINGTLTNPWTNMSIG